MSNSKKILQKKNDAIKERISIVSDEIRIQNIKNLKDSEIAKLHMVEASRMKDM